MSFGVESQGEEQWGAGKGGSLTTSNPPLVPREPTSSSMTPGRLGWVSVSRGVLRELMEVEEGLG